MSSLQLDDSRYQHGLQALRGILALGVFMQHVFWQASTIVPHSTTFLYSLNVGGTGVLTFFALSGYLMVGKVTDPPRKYFLDRVRRIFPAFWICVVIATWFRLGPGFSFRTLPWDVLFLVPNGKPNVLALPHWSLYFEVCFYAIVFAVALLRPSLGRVVVVLWGILSLALYKRPYDFANYSAPNLYNLVFPLYGIFFAAGVLAGWRFRPSRRSMLGYAAAALVIFFYPAVLQELAIPYPWPLSHEDVRWALYALGCLAAVRAALSWRASSPPGRILKWIGDASYGMYLIHILVMARLVPLVAQRFVPRTYAEAAILIVALTLPPSLLFGYGDVWLQQVLKRVQRRLTPGRHA